MSINEKAMRDLVAAPSLGAVVYQALELREALERIGEDSYPAQACVLRDVLLAITEHVIEELLALRDPDRPHGIHRDPGFLRGFGLARIVRELYSYLRFLKTAAPDLAPEPLQRAMASLVRLHTPCSEKAGMCLVRPKWKYSFSMLPLSWELRDLLIVDLLNGRGLFDIADGDEIERTDHLLDAIWRRWREGQSPDRRERLPESASKHIGVVSFAGIDTGDALLFPLLAHELGHFADLCATPPLHLSDEFLRVINTAAGEAGPDDRALQPRLQTCVRELLADSIAARMLGFGFFVAQAEFLKTVAAWPEPQLTASGYPGIQLRLRVILNELERLSPMGVTGFLRQSSDAGPEESRWALSYIESWRERIAAATAMDERSTPKHVAHAIEQLLPIVAEAARNAVPNERAAGLTPGLFARVRLLVAESVPTLDGDSAESLPEIFAAAWCYQLLHGEVIEAALGGMIESRDHYRSACARVLEAIARLDLESPSPWSRTLSRPLPAGDD